MNDRAGEAAAGWPQDRPRPKEDPRADPASIGDLDRGRDQIEAWPRKVVRSGAKKRPLRDAAIIPDRHLCQAQDQDFIADPDVVAAAKSPRERDVDFGADDDPMSDLCPETAEPKGFDRGRDGKLGVKKDPPYQEPKDFLPAGGATVEIAVVEGR